jgi:hypothetical protein
MPILYQYRVTLNNGVKMLANSYEGPDETDRVYLNIPIQNWIVSATYNSGI